MAGTPGAIEGLAARGMLRPRSDAGTMEAIVALELAAISLR